MVLAVRTAGRVGHRQAGSVFLRIKDRDAYNAVAIFSFLRQGDVEVKKTVLLGRDRGSAERPWQDLEHQLALLPGRHSHRLSFMSEDHHRVRNYAVTQLVQIAVFGSSTNC